MSHPLLSFASRDASLSSIRIPSALLALQEDVERSSVSKFTLQACYAAGQVPHNIDKHHLGSIGACRQERDAMEASSSEHIKKGWSISSQVAAALELPDVVGLTADLLYTSEEKVELITWACDLECLITRTKAAASLMVQRGHLCICLPIERAVRIQGTRLPHFSCKSVSPLHVVRTMCKPYACRLKTGLPTVKLKLHQHP